MPEPGFDIYVNLELGIEVEAHVLKEHEIQVFAEFFDIPYFKAGDVLIHWGNGRTHTVVTPEIFAHKYRKKETDEHNVQDSNPGDDGSPDEAAVEAQDSEAPEAVQAATGDEEGSLQSMT